MGRSFSVYLFCLAMDPLFTYLNQIPGVLAIQGYVDDTTIAGDGQDRTWIENVESCYQALQTAGFVIDPHACYFAGVVINNRDIPHKCLSASVDVAWPGLLQTKPFPTAMAALLANRKRGYNTVLVRKGPPTDAPPNAHEPQQYQCIVAVYTFQQIIEMDEGSHMHRIGSFATLGCACKSKSPILCNVALRSLAQRRVEATRFGIQAVRSHAFPWACLRRSYLTMATLFTLHLAHISKSLILLLPGKCLTGLSRLVDPLFPLWLAVLGITPLS